MEIIIGRQGNQHIAITDMTVSRKHCKITSQPDGSFILENLSPNGTYVDGNSVIRTIVNPDTVIRLGNSFSIKVKDLISTEHLISNGDKMQSPSVSIEHLKKVYDKYSEDKIAIQKEAGMNNFYRMLPMTLLSLIALGSTAVPALSSIAPLFGIFGILLLVYSLHKSYSCSKENPERMEALNRQFMIDYTCPKCGNFLGFVPYETLKNKGKCSFCKCNWKK